MFCLRCDPLHSKFVLSTEWEEWKRTFDSFEAAYEYAETCVSEKVPIVLFNSNGAFIVKTTVFPLAPALRFGADWRDLSALDQIQEDEIHADWLAGAEV